ncbi:MAG: hypothetical protein CMQ40_02800 [Gammaproteobacteria bacterium]|nr:hypothetical protein [Gammaproteobacteria bacterium]
MKIFSALFFALLFATSPKAISETMAPTPINKETNLREKITVDGVLDESVWELGTLLTDFKVVEPDTLEKPEYDTDVSILYDQRGIYIGAKLYQPRDTLIARLSARDQFLNRDGLVIVIDPSGQGLYGYFFSLNLGGAMTDGTALPERKFSREWDGPWEGATQTSEKGWSAEYFLSWNMFNMPLAGKERTIGFGAKRLVAHRGEGWQIPPLPDTGPIFLSGLKKLLVNNISPKQSTTFYPYISSSYDSLAHRDQHKSGFDIFWRPSSNLQLSATVNPDFGNVESDDVDVNLSSYETFFSEKRAFFLEGQEIFTASAERKSGGKGKNPLLLVNTRRIGSPPLDPGIEDFEYSGDTATKPTELLGAAKITGQAGKLRYGILSAIEKDSLLTGFVGDNEIALSQKGRDFHAMRLLYENNDSGLRKGFGWISTLVAHPQGDAYVHGIDGHFLSRNAKWKIDGQALYSEEDSVSGFGSYLDLRFTPKKGVKHDLSLEYYDSEFDLNDFGFLRRNDTYGASYRVVMTRSDLKSVKSRRVELGMRHEFNGENLAVRKGFFSNISYEFKKNHKVGASLAYLPSRWDDRNARGNGTYRIKDRVKSGLSFRSDRSRKISHGISLSFEEEHIGGSSRDVEYDITWRPIPNFSAVLDISYANRSGWLIYQGDRDLATFKAEIWEPELKIEFTPAPKQQFRLTTQWVGIKAFEKRRWFAPEEPGRLIQDVASDQESRDFSISKLIFQARYRWEIAPLSDLFVVYTRGSDLPNSPQSNFKDLLTDSWSNRKVDSLIVKLRYRLGN